LTEKKEATIPQVSLGKIISKSKSFTSKTKINSFIHYEKKMNRKQFAYQRYRCFSNFEPEIQMFFTFSSFELSLSA
jgi:hypothetical protein